MYRKLLPLMLAAALAGCASQNTSSSSSATARAAGDKTCDAESMQKQVGKTYTDSLGDDIRKGSQSSALRVLRPGQVMTLEYNPMRVNIIIDGQGKVSAVRCG
ncbi:I78 family peptidase inhibitor [Bordetella trematum]|uniref:I78 family peptidase inhibitor n=1 Tax=Bordetella trematum TaxID=123899 RepID=UPI00052F0FD2|nr:I78 family peptidase inhibitor [Bordetella trematum]